MSKLAAIAAAAAVLALGSVATAQPPRGESPAANVRESRQYEQLLRTNPAFRAKRIREECGPITDPQLHRQCVASFPPPGKPIPPYR